MRRLCRDQSGSVSIEVALTTLLMTLLTAGAVEAGWVLQQHSSAQTAARHGARLAATLDPVSADLDQRAVATSAFDVTCDGARSVCTQGTFDTGRMQRIVYGPDGDGACAAALRERRGMCDLYAALEPHHVSVRYASSGLAGANASNNPAPLITVTIARRPARTVLLGPLLPRRFTHLPATSATLMGEDLDG